MNKELQEQLIGKKHRPKNWFFGFKCDKTFRERLEAYCDSINVKYSEFIRDCIEKGIKGEQK